MIHILINLGCLGCLGCLSSVGRVSPRVYKEFEMLSVICQYAVHCCAEHRTGNLCRQNPAIVEHGVTTSKVCSMIRLLHSCDFSCSD